MSSALNRALSLLEYMVMCPMGATVSDIAKTLDMPISGVHRLLKELESIGYVRQNRNMGEYELTIKLASLGLAFLGQTGIADISQPILDGLAAKCGELVRLSLADGEQLIWVGVAQGATSGLRYDPGSEQGQVVHLASSAGGQAWLAEMSDEEAIARVMKQGLLKPLQPGQSAPTTVKDLLSVLAEVRTQGYSRNADSFLAGMAAMAKVIHSPSTGAPIGVVSIAGPSVRLTLQRMETLVPALYDAAKELGEASRASVYFSKIVTTPD
ncbi:IclR family transcriptional regulator [Nitrincola alkalisediminis]|uniref:IclR family transcriptional regulator n=1 Tax=Nitrincola alkalisediminis TaxID=1366656 RepID=UPI0018737CEC|nr:IclR family transcriptional regulator [Nitrincola alkalisediminis]